VDEASLRQQCGTTESGTLADDLVKCAHTLGFAAEKEYSSLDRLRQHLAAGLFPILYVNMLFIDGIDSVHALVPTEFEEQFINVIDPLEGERYIPLIAFDKSWQMLNNLAILVYPQKQ
jgi:ABC-type bacteriocin/lantibiotic exporter with double-glycine peptidase domain